MFDFLSELGPLPFFTAGPWEFGPVKIHSFGLMVAIGVLSAHTISIRRVERFGHDPDAARSLYMAGLLMGFISAHVLNVIMYEPMQLIKNPAVLFHLNGSLSSYGGVIGAFLGVGLWARFHPSTELRPLIEPVFFAVPFGWFWGRVGCSLVHDHPGRLTDFFLAIDYGSHPPGGVRHDLGFYEAIWWFILIIVFIVVDRTRGDAVRKPYGFYGPLLAILYTPARFTLDFLRISPDMGGDARYLGLTPAQYISLFFFTVGVVFMVRWVKAHRALVEAEGEKPPQEEEAPIPEPEAGGDDDDAPHDAGQKPDAEPQDDDRTPLNEAPAPQATQDNDGQEEPELDPPSQKPAAQQVSPSALSSQKGSGGGNKGGKKKGGRRKKKKR